MVPYPSGSSNTSGMYTCFRAYLSEVDDHLGELLLGPTRAADPPLENEASREVRTGERIAELRSRSGQSAFSLAVRQNYDFECCFPDFSPWSLRNL